MKLEDFELVINYTFNDQSHLLHAIQHKSFNKIKTAIVVDIRYPKRVAIEVPSIPSNGIKK